MSTELATTNLPSRYDDKFDRIVKYYRCSLPDNDPNKARLPADLEKQLKHWITIHALLSTGRYPKTSQRLNAILKAIPSISPRTARNYLDDTTRFFGILDQPNLAYEKVMQIEEVRDDIKLAKRKGDMKAVASLRKIYIELIGANKEAAPVDNRTIVNIINYNPEQLGGQMISDEAIEQMTQQLLAEDKKKQAELFDSYTDVTAHHTDGPVQDPA